MRIRLFLAFSAIVIITAAAVVGIAALAAGREVRQFIQRGGLSGNEWLVESLEAHYQDYGSWQGADRIFRNPRPGIGYGNGGGGRPAPAPGLGDNILLAGPDGRVILDNGSEPELPISLTEAELEEAIPLYHRGEQVGYLLPENRFSVLPAVELALLSRLNRSALIAAAIAGVFALGLAFGLAYILQRPIRELTRAAAAMAEGDLSQRVQPRGRDEIATLSKTFNEMAASLEMAEKRRKALTADIAHELRNPLAVQRANLEALRDGLYPLEKEHLDPVLQQNMLLERLVEDLRTLALADAGQLPLDRVPTDLLALLRRMSALQEPAFMARSIRLQQDLAENCPRALVDPGRIEQIITNLMDNALQHTPEGGRVTLSLACGSEEFILTVHDNGPGIPEEDLPHIFERFYRADKSRSRSEGHTGLGLSIARRIAEAHGGRLEAANHPQGGAVFTLSLPNSN